MHGSDSVALETSARRDGDEWVIEGTKKWIGNGTLADVIVVWARDVADGHVKGFLVEKDTPGCDARRIDGKGSLRAVWQAEIALSGVRVPEQNRLPGATSFKDAGRVLAGTRNAVAWGALGHATAAYEAAVAYCRQRQQFGKPLVSFQIVQDRLVKMLAEVCSMQLYCLRLGRLIEEGKLTDTIAAIAKMNNTRKARQVIAEARDLVGGNGILLDFHVNAAPGRHRGDPHLRRHRDHPDPHRRPGHHRCQRLRLTAGPSGSSTSTPTGSGCAPRGPRSGRPGAADHRPLLQRYIARELYPLIIDALRTLPPRPRNPLLRAAERSRAAGHPRRHRRTWRLTHRLRRPLPAAVCQRPGRLRRNRRAAPQGARPRPRHAARRPCPRRWSKHRREQV